MALYRHATNLSVPLSQADANLLLVLPDYRLGLPVTPPTPRENDANPPNDGDLLLNGYVGLYATREALKDPAVQKLTGWPSPDRVLTVPWRPFGNIEVKSDANP